MKKLISFFLERSLLVNMISIAVFLAGMMFLFSANRAAFPKVDYNYVIITTIYPGATSADIEKHISIPIEDQLHEIEGIDEIYSSSYESRSSVVLKLEADIKNMDKTVSDIQNAVEMVDDLPKEAEKPIVTELNSSLFPIVEISISNKQGIHSDADERELRNRAKMLEDKFLEIDGVAQIDKKGYRDREMLVEVHPRLIDEYHIGLNEIIMALSKKNLNFPGGQVQTGSEDVLIRTIGEVQSAEEIRNVLIRANDMGNWVRIGDVASVKNSFKEAEILNKTDGEKSITLTVIKKESADIIDVVRAVEKVTHNNKTLKENSKYKITTSNDLSYYVKRRLKVLVNNAIVGLILVVLSLLISLGFRISFVTALGLPLAFSGTFIWMSQRGISINLISMFGLIIVLGMLVDDAIVVAENVYRHMEEGEPLKEAVLNGTSEVVLPVLGTILTTIAAFSPLMFMTGIMGKFMWALPAVVTVALVSSWIEAMFILPSHIYDIEKGRKSHTALSQKEGKLYYKIRDKYVSMLEYVLTHKYRFALLITVIFFGTLIFAKFNVKMILFPQGKIERFVIKAEAKTGTSLYAMEKKISKLEGIIRTLPKGEIDNYISQTGIISEQPMDPGTKRGTNYGTLLVNLTPEEDRTRKAVQIMDDLRGKTKKFSDEFTKLEVKYIRNGPPVGNAVSIAIMGKDFGTLKKVALEFEAYLHKISDKYSYTINGKKISALKDIKNNFEEGKKELQIYVDEKTARIAGISVYDVASTVRTCFKGTIATKIKKSDEEIGIRVLFPEKYRDDLKSLDIIKIMNMRGNLVPLKQIAHFKYTRGISVINRQKWKRSIVVTADIDEHAEKMTSNELNKMMMKRFKKLDSRYPGVVVNYLGEFKDTQESMQNLIRSFIFAFVIIYVILVALFRSLGHPFIIINVIPLTAIGVIWAFYIHGMPLSFLAMMGIVGLAGVVVNDSIVFMDFIKRGRSQGLSPLDASLQAGGQRIRAIFLTTITTVFGLLPTAYGWGGYDPFLKPMAVAMAWGLAFGTFITLFATPLLYNIVADLRSKVFRKSRTPDSFAVRDYYKNEIEEDIKTEVEEDLLNVIRQDLSGYIHDEIKGYFEQGNSITKSISRDIRKKLKSEIIMDLKKDNINKKKKAPQMKKSPGKK